MGDQRRLCGRGKSFVPRDEMRKYYVVDPTNDTKWKHTWRHHSRDNVWDTAVSKWAGDEEWMTKRSRLRTNADREEFIMRVVKLKHGQQEKKEQGKQNQDNFRAKIE